MSETNEDRFRKAATKEFFQATKTIVPENETEEELRQLLYVVFMSGAQFGRDYKRRKQPAGD